MPTERLLWSSREFCGFCGVGEGDGAKVGECRSAFAWRTRATMAGGPHDSSGRGDEPGDRAPLRTRRALTPAGKSLLVSVLRRRHGNGLAFIRHHDERDRGAETRVDAAPEGARDSRLRWAREVLAANAAGAE